MRARSARISITILAVITAVALSITCGGDSTTTPKDDTGGQPTSLSISLSVSSAMPGAEVDIAGIPAGVDLSGSYMIVREVGSTAATLTGIELAVAQTTSSTSIISRHADGTPYFVAPLRPAEFMNGGPVELTLGGTGPTSNVVPFTVEPLPAATVSVQDLVGELQDLLTTWLEVHGTTREELRAMDPTTMPAVLYPLWHAHEILDSPDNPNSMRAAVDGPTPFFDNALPDYDVINRMLSQTDVVSFLGEEVTSIDSLTTLDSLQVTASGLPQMQSRVSLNASACNIPAGDYGIDTASKLDIAMIKSRAAASRIEGFTGDVLSKWSDAAIAAGVIPSLKAGATVVSGGLYVFKLVNEAAANLLPTSLDYDATDFDVADNDFEYNEDDTGGFWTNFRVTGVSQGWKLDEAALKAILKIAKFRDFGGLNSEVPIGQLSDLEQNLSSYVVTQGTKFIISEVTGGDNILEVCPGRWPDIDASSSLYCKSEIAFGTSFVMSSHTFFETREPGVSQLKVQTADGKFGGVPPTKKTKSIEVVAIDVSIAPSAVRMEPSEVQTFDAVVTNASDDKVEWFVPAPLQELSRENFGKTIVVQAPPPGTTLPASVILRARSQANTGSRKDKVDSDPRDGVAAITFKDSVVIHVEPRYICLSPGDDSSFVAVVTGLDEYNVIWEIVEGYGTLDQNGHYQSLAYGTSYAKISARVEGYPDAIDNVYANVSACNCSYRINVPGGPYEGGQVAYLFSDLPEGFHNYQFFYMLRVSGAPEGVSFSMNLGPTENKEAPRPGQTGFFEVGASYFDGFSSWATIDSTTTVELEILEHTDTYMIGHYSGHLGRGLGEDVVTIPVSGTFRAGRWDGGRWPCE